MLRFPVSGNLMVGKHISIIR